MKIPPWNSYQIFPEQIKADQPFAGGFGSWEAKEVARAIVRYCQHEDGWQPFIEDDLKKFFGRGRSIAENVRDVIEGVVARGLRELQGGHYLEKDEEHDQVYYVNERFIDCCHAVSPAGNKV